MQRRCICEGLRDVSWRRSWTDRVQTVAEGWRECSLFLVPSSFLGRSVVRSCDRLDTGCVGKVGGTGGKRSGREGAKARRREQRCVGWQIATGDSPAVKATRQNTASSEKSNRVAGRGVVAKVVPDEQAVGCFGDRATVGETCRSGRGGQRRRAPNHATLAGHGGRSEAEHTIESC